MTMPTVPTATLDRAVFDELGRMLGRRSLTNLVELFSERAATMDELRTASRRADGAELTRITHTLKGGAATLAAMRLAELARALEERGRTGSFEEAEELAEEAMVEFDRALGAMHEALASMPAEDQVAAAADSTADST